MAQIIVHDLPEDVVARLKAKAAVEGQSLEAYVRRVLEDVSRLSLTEFLAIANAIAETTVGRQQTDSTDSIRASRDQGW